MPGAAASTIARVKRLRAMCNAAQAPVCVMLNAAELPSDAPPEWLLLMPAGDTFTGVDGRSFRSPGAAAVIAAHKGSPHLPVDVNHASIARAPAGEEAPAVGWVEELAERNGGELWGRVSWNERGKTLIANREYRYPSPVYWPDDSGAIARIHSVGLVNSPNLDVGPLFSNQEDPMDLAKIAQALGLQANATEAQVLQAIAERLPASTAPGAGAAGQMVPKADYDLMANRAKTAEKTLADRDTEDLRAEAEAEVDKAIEAGKVAPASRDYYLANCSTAEGLTAFKKFAADAPEIVKAGATAPEGPAPNAATTKPEEETDEAKEVARQMGVDEVLAGLKDQKKE